MQKGSNMYFKVCDRCGSNLDPGESCDCLERDEASKHYWASLTYVNSKGQLVLKANKEEEAKDGN